MSDSNLQQAAAVEADATSAIKHYCPEDGAVMYEGVMDDLPAWICPECGYFEYK